MNTQATDIQAFKSLDPFYGLSQVKVGGPPGTGKTTLLMRQVRSALEHGVVIGETHGAVYGDQIMIVTFTRAAATTIRQRLEADMDPALIREVDAIRVGTLHSLAIRELTESGVTVQVARSGASLKDWNARYPHWTLSEQSGDSNDQAQTRADDMLQAIDRLRGTLTEPEHWPERLKGLKSSVQEHLLLWKTYQEWKAEGNLMDFTDIIERAHNCVVTGTILLMDESQDFSPLEFQLVQTWGVGFFRRCVIGDDDQSIYAGLKGASPQAFVDLQADEGGTLVLEQSWRVPRLVQELAQRTLEGIAPERRWKKQYLPRDEDGLIGRSAATAEDPAPLLGLLEAVTQRAEQGLGGEVMILAHSRKALLGTIALLKRSGIPYHNPYAHNGQWSPLPVLSGERAGARERTLAFLACAEALQRGESPSASNLKLATERLSGAFRRGQGKRARALLEEQCEAGSGEEAAPDQAWDALEDDSRQALRSGDLDWMIEHLDSPSKRAESWRVAYELARLGRLDMTPGVIIGTIHSVKGAEADHVVLFPDLSAAREDLDEESLRLMYVAMTRARHGLILCTPSGQGPSLPMERLLGSAQPHAQAAQQESTLGIVNTARRQRA